MTTTTAVQATFHSPSLVAPVVAPCGSGAVCATPGLGCTTTVNLQRVGPLDPASKVMIADVPRWAHGGGLANKQVLNAFKIQGALEVMSQLGIASPTAALTKNVGAAQAVVSRVTPLGDQPLQNYLSFPYDMNVPATAALSTAPTQLVWF